MTDWVVVTAWPLPPVPEGHIRVLRGHGNWAGAEEYYLLQARVTEKYKQQITHYRDIGKL